MREFYQANSIVYNFYCVNVKFYCTKFYYMFFNAQILLRVNFIMRILLCKFIMQISSCKFVKPSP